MSSEVKDFVNLIVLIVLFPILVELSYHGIVGRPFAVVPFLIVPT